MASDWRAGDRSGPVGGPALDRFPVHRTPRPLVVWQTAQSDGGFSSGEAKSAFLYGLVSASATVPEAVLAALAELGARVLVDLDSSPCDVTCG